ncbi:glyoxalase superfamily protein [Roseibium aggregatum]|nr:glyoxalase superfamily protein [Roseibium aggregatum]
MKLEQPTPELPVADVKAAQRYFRDFMGFEIGWFHPEGAIGAVSHGNCAIFFRETKGEIHPATFWIFSADVDEAHAELAARGADIVDPVDDKPWGLRQFTVKDFNGNLFHFHHDLSDSETGT